MAGIEADPVDNCSSGAWAGAEVAAVSASNTKGITETVIARKATATLALRGTGYQKRGGVVEFSKQEALQPCGFCSRFEDAR